MQNKSKYMSEKLYREAMSKLVIACVDVVVKTPKGVLIGIRNYKPMKGKRWLIGGRIFFGEKPELAVVRKVKEETGLKVKVERFVGTYSIAFTKEQRRSNIALVFFVKQTGGKLKLTEEYSKFIFLKRMEKGLHPYVKRALIDSRVFGGKAARKKAGKIPYFLN